MLTLIGFRRQIIETVVPGLPFDGNKDRTVKPHAVSRFGRDAVALDVELEIGPFDNFHIRERRPALFIDHRIGGIHFIPEHMLQERNGPALNAVYRVYRYKYGITGIFM